MHVIGQNKLAAISDLHPEVRSFLQCWLVEAKQANWSCEDDLLQDYQHAQFSGPKDVVFTIGRGKVRLSVRALFRKKMLRIDDVGLLL